MDYLIYDTEDSTYTVLREVEGRLGKWSGSWRSTLNRWTSFRPDDTECSDIDSWLSKQSTCIIIYSAEEIDLQQLPQMFPELCI